MPARADRPPLALDQALAELHARASTGRLAENARVGIRGTTALGVTVPQIRAVSRLGPADNGLAAQLWQTGIHEARQLAAMVSDAATVPPDTLDRWASEVESWDVCDGLASLVAESPHGWAKVAEWASREEEYTRRCAFATLAMLAVHDRTAGDDMFVEALALVSVAASDERNFVKKAVNWALRQAGKRNRALNLAAIACAEELRASQSPAARWIAADALRELRSDAVQARLGE